MSLMMHPQVADAVSDSSPAVVSFTKPLLSPPLRSNSTTTTSCSNSSNTSTNSTSSSSTSSTNKLILDYLLYLSIQSRLKQAEVELADDNTEATEKRWIEAASRAEKDKRAVESVVAGVLSGGNAPFNDLDQRLHLCQLANLVFGRFNNTSSSSSEHVITQHNTSTSTHRRVRRNNNHAQEQINTGVFSNTIQSAFCRRHRRQDCPSQQCKSTCASSAPGLTDAIPVFLKASADLLRLTLDNTSEDAVPMVFAGQRVMGGGMPPRWYDLFLELLTQAAIESYMCDGQSGLEPIHEIFSFGDVEDEDEPDQEDEEDEDEEDEDEEEEAAEEDEDDEDEEDEWGVSAADHHLLFPKTRTMFLFKTQRREREKEFLMVEGDDDLTQHFIKLAQRYPLEAFEKSMNEFIQMTLSSTEKPALSEQGTTSTEANALPQIYKYLGDGSLLMPEIPEEDGNSSTATTDTNAMEQQQHGQKRRASLDEEQDLPDPKRSR
ncbi:hypothetical protein O0I10_010987 [Lichtheimia ornata]|uniref:Uncharacterized protein n=1 Tax=Lichtheimia ornata TaxID=688661 RepID=A0AAD7UWC5_9FUNG|nr:uncharacterized protein O0I10_010987 [Lichtheimia ornata]KAJ8653336.1 hypothetical protein O0I10_010987 [Lichtheimia ornata]